MAIDYEKILKDYQVRLNYERRKCDNPKFLVWVMKQYANGKFTDEEIAEQKGWRNALTYADELLKEMIDFEKNVT